MSVKLKKHNFIRLSFSLIVAVGSFDLAGAMSPPPNYSQSNMPQTNFTCDDKATGGYYADPEAGCQMFHVCVRISDDEMNDFRFLCPNDTVFDQQNFICTNWWEINCEKSTRYYSKNDLFKVNDQAPEYEYEEADKTDPPVYYEYIYEYVDSQQPSQNDNLPRNEASLKEKDNDHHRFQFGKSQKGESRSDHSSSVTFRKTSQVSSSVFTTTTAKPTTTVSAPILKTTKHVSRIHFERVSLNPPVTNKRQQSHLTRTTIPPHYQIVTHQSPNSNSDFSRIKSHREENNAKPKLQSTFWPPRVQENTRHKDDFQVKSEENSRRSASDITKSRKTSETSGTLTNSRRNKVGGGGVTASAKTRYEALFGATSSRGREFTESHKQQISDRLNRKRIPQDKPSHSRSTNIKNPFVRSQPSRVFDPSRSRHRNRQGEPMPDDVVSVNTRRTDIPRSKLEEFSKFRFYKTAFGRSYSSNDLLGSTGTTAAPFQLSNPVKPEKTASRNTRYSVYAE